MTVQRLIIENIQESENTPLLAVLGTIKEWER
jgi:hypothetical protein